MHHSKAVEPLIRSFILEKFPAARKQTLAEDLPLLESGIMDSLGVLDLVTFIEETFGLRLEDDELSPDNFDNLRCIVSFVESKRGRVEVSAG